MILEIFFRLLPVSYPPHILAVDESNPIARFQTNTDYLWSNGWDFNIVSRKHTNNLGYASDYDYVMSNLDPLMVIIGDSFVEAHQVANAESMSGVLAEKVKQNGRVYSLGLSGAPLSQYLVFAEYAKDTLNADAMVFSIVANDFDESLIRYKSRPRFHYFEEKDGLYVLTRIDYKLGVLKKILRKSAFVRYIWLNLAVKQLQESNAEELEGVQSQFVGYVPRNVSVQRLKDSERAVDEFFRQLTHKSGLDSDNILFVVDGMRPNLYAGDGLVDAQDSFFDHMRSYFISTAKQLEYEVIDMQPVFIKKNRHDGSIFEFKRDGHWNRLGHKMVAHEILNSDVFNKTFSATE